MSLAKQNESGKDESSILIVDFYPVVRLGLIHLINNSKGLRVCGEAENAHEAVEAIKVLKPDMVIIDIFLKGLNGIELIERIKLQYPHLPILVFSMSDESFYAERVLRAGANGYIMKHLSLKMIMEAIRRVLLGEIFVSNKIALKIMHKSVSNRSSGSVSPIDLLSNRELAVFRLIGQGYRTRRIAGKLFLSVRTIETYRAQIKNKLKLKNGDELLRQAIQWVQSER